MKTRIAKTLMMAGVFIGALQAAPAKAGDSPWLGEIAMFGGNFCPRGWAAADGQLLAISQYSALFALYGTIYGGDGRTTFALPDLRGRAPIHVGRGPGLADARLGDRSGGYEVNRGPRSDITGTRTATLAINYCVSLLGIFPSRN